MYGRTNAGFGFKKYPAIAFTPTGGTRKEYNLKTAVSDSYVKIARSGENWEFAVLTSGLLEFTNASLVDLFGVGAGGNGGRGQRYTQPDNHWYWGGSGAAGGDSANYYKEKVKGNYSVTVTQNSNTIFGTHTFLKGGNGSGGYGPAGGTNNMPGNIGKGGVSAGYHNAIQRYSSSGGNGSYAFESANQSLLYPTTQFGAGGGGGGTGSGGADLSGASGGVTGGGAGQRGGTAGGDATANTGSGGGGTGSDSTEYTHVGQGAAGIIIIRNHR